MRAMQILRSLGVLVVLSTGAAAQDGQTVALILDASGSMNARLASGQSRIDAAKAAVLAFVGKIDPATRLSLRAYGHQSPTRERNCNDTQMLVDFDAAARNRGDIEGKVGSITARGYTPITRVITLAAGDVGKQPGSRAVVLVSDGKETCEGDPCAAAKALAEADAKLTIHTIGFNVDAAARYQLQCIARVARGSYWDASNAADLGDRLNEAATARPAPPPAAVTSVTVTRPRPGKLQINPIGTERHDVVDASSGQKVGSISNLGSIIDLPEGLYNVTFGKRVWKSVEVRAGETTVLRPGLLEVKHASVRGHKIVDFETEEEAGSVSQTASTRILIPSSYSVQFGNVFWRNIELKPGERTVLNPGVVVVRGLDARGHPIKTEAGATAVSVSSLASTVPLPPGKYALQVGNNTVPIDLHEGETFEIKLK